jgi:hypothetical protein
MEALEQHLRKGDRVLPMEALDDPKRVTPSVVEQQLIEEPKVIQAVPQQQYKQDALLEQSLSQEVVQETNIKTVSKELFNRQNIELKTEVSHNEINHVAKLKFLQERFGVANIDVLCDNFLALRVSKDRKSRGEFVSSLQADNKAQQGGSFLSKMFGGGTQGGQP